MGRPESTSDAAGERVRTYDPSSLLLAGETFGGTGLLAGRSLTRTFDTLNRPASLVTDGGYEVGYDYDGAGRLESVTKGVHEATYGYKAGVGSVESVILKQSAVERVRHEHVTDRLDRMAQVRSLSGTVVLAESIYAYNDANQRTRVTREDQAYWSYGYDGLGQVTSGKKYRANDTLINGLDDSWSFDDIGNRKTSVANGQATTYASNLLNQYASRTVPGVIDVMGEANADATVTVTMPATAGTVYPVTRQDEGFFLQLTVNNATAPHYSDLKVTGVKNNVGPNGEDAVTEELRTAYLPQTPELFVHDSDGNLTGDGRWSYTWDAENRLVAIETTVAAVAAGVPKQKLEFVYDSQSRRIAKRVYGWDAGTSAFVLQSSALFVYDGWNMIAELDALASNAAIRTYVWGIDLSGVMQGAGGIGGPLFANLGTETHAAAHDGNGNVIGLVDMATGEKSATYDYNAFGETIIANGLGAAENPFRSSSKYTDAETGLLYYGFRYYNPSTGRWPNRDPMGEEGGVNLYRFVDNDPISGYDVLGLWTAKGVVKFLCKTEAGRGLLQAIKEKQATGWRLKSFDEMETDVYFGDGSKRREMIPGVNGYTDKKNKIIYLRDSSDPDEEAAKSLTHEWFHSNRLPNTTREGLLDEENSVYYLTEYMAPDIGYPKNPDYYNKPSDPFPDYDFNWAKNWTAKT